MNDIHARRLAFIKYLWRRADADAEQPEPFQAAAVLSFHDAVELFLQLASEAVDSGAAQPNFLDYWDLIAKKLPDGLSGKEAMRRLNKARVALKHHGTMPSSLDIRGFRVATREFFDDNTQRVFGTSFDAISLAMFVDPPEVRADIEEAVLKLAQGSVEESLESSATAFHRLLRHAEALIANRWGLSPFEASPGLARYRHFPSFRDLDDRDRQLARFAQEVVESIDKLQDALRLMSLGVNYHRLVRFRQATPSVVQTMDGKLHLTWSRAAVSSPQQTDPLAQFCIEFVIDTALQLGKDSGVHVLFRGMEL